MHELLLRELFFGTAVGLIHLFKFSALHLRVYNGFLNENVDRTACETSVWIICCSPFFSLLLTSCCVLGYLASTGDAHVSFITNKPASELALDLQTDGCDLASEMPAGNTAGLPRGLGPYTCREHRRMGAAHRQI